MKGKIVLSVAVILGLVSFFLDSKTLSAASAVQNTYISYIMEWFSNLSSLIIVLAVLSSLLLWEERKKGWIKVVWLSFIAASVLSIAAKLAVARPRLGLYEGFLLSQYSFPSMHAALAFSLLPILDKEFPKLKWFWVAFAFLVATSRLYLRAHYLSDVVWGAILGYVVGKTMVIVEENQLLKRFLWKKAFR